MSDRNCSHSHPGILESRLLGFYHAVVILINKQQVVYISLFFLYLTRERQTKDLI